MGAISCAAFPQLEVIVPCLSCAGEVRGQINFPDTSASVFLSGAQQPTPVTSPAVGFGSVYIINSTAVNVSLTLSGLANTQTLAHLHYGGVCVCVCVSVCECV